MCMQVRFAASVGTRAFMEALGQGTREVHFSVLLPGMCLNRYYVAEGVRLYSQETWRIVMGEEGRYWTAKHAPQVYLTALGNTAVHSHADMPKWIESEALSESYTLSTLIYYTVTHLSFLHTARP